MYMFINRKKPTRFYIHIPSFVPESLRYLTVKGKLNEAEAVVARIAKTNGKPLPTLTSQVLEVT